MFEKIHDKIAPLSVFIFRLFCTVTGGFLLITIIIAVGTLNFHIYENMNWIDAFTNAAMTFADMGLSFQPATTSGKIFASIYALFCQLAFLAIVALIFSPIVHRFYHQFHSTHSKHAQK
jgi:hypothetical protein